MQLLLHLWRCSVTLPLLTSWQRNVRSNQRSADLAHRAWLQLAVGAVRRAWQTWRSGRGWRDRDTTYTLALRARVLWSTRALRTSYRGLCSMWLCFAERRVAAEKIRVRRLVSALHSWVRGAAARGETLAVRSVAAALATVHLIALALRVLMQWHTQMARRRAAVHTLLQRRLRRGQAHATQRWRDSALRAARSWILHVEGTRRWTYNGSGGGRGVGGGSERVKAIEVDRGQDRR